MVSEAVARPDGLLVDWKAVFWAGLVSGTVFLLLNLFVVPPLMDGNLWISVRLAFPPTFMSMAAAGPPGPMR